VTRYAAFLRAINVGGHVVKMDALRRRFEGLGLSGVETHIASGNVVFHSTARDPAALERRIARDLERALGYAVATFVRTIAELDQIAGHRPFTEDAGASVYIGFLPRPLDAAGRRAVMALRPPDDEFAIHQRELYWLCRTRFGRAEFSPARMEKVLGLPATFRGAGTVRKMAQRFGGAAS
jgi:uncharacterized protein (DUF1697 family)